MRSDKRFAVWFGAALGVGWLTIIPFIGFHLACIACVATGAPLLGAAVMAPFGAFRSLGVWMTARLVVDAAGFSREMPTAIADGHAFADTRYVSVLRILSLAVFGLTTVAS